MDTGPSVAFGTLLRRYRVAAGLTQEELAERAGISRRSLGDWERGVAHTPRRDTVALLAAALALAPPERSAFVEAMRPKNTSRVGRECARPRRGDYGSTTLMTTTTSMVTSHSMPDHAGE